MYFISYVISFPFDSIKGKKKSLTSVIKYNQYLSDLSLNYFLLPLNLVGQEETWKCTGKQCYHRMTVPIIILTQKHVTISCSMSF